MSHNFQATALDCQEPICPSFREVTLLRIDWKCKFHWLFLNECKPSQRQIGERLNKTSKELRLKLKKDQEKYLFSQDSDYYYRETYQNDNCIQCIKCKLMMQESCYPGPCKQRNVYCLMTDVLFCPTILIKHGIIHIFKFLFHFNKFSIIF